MTKHQWWNLWIDVPTGETEQAPVYGPMTFKPIMFDGKEHGVEVEREVIGHKEKPVVERRDEMVRAANRTQAEAKGRAMCPTATRILVMFSKVTHAPEVVA